MGRWSREHAQICWGVGIVSEQWLLVGAIEKGIPGFWEQRKRKTGLVPLRHHSSRGPGWPSNLLGLCLSTLNSRNVGKALFLTKLVCDELKLSHPVEPSLASLCPLSLCEILFSLGKTYFRY